MSDRWPAVMRRPTAAAYLDLSPSGFDKVVNLHKIPAIQLTERGERMYHKEDLDAYLEGRRRERVKAS